MRGAVVGRVALRDDDTPPYPRDTPDTPQRVTADTPGRHAQACHHQVRQHLPVQLPVLHGLAWWVNTRVLKRILIQYHNFQITI